MFLNPERIIGVSLLLCSVNILAEEIPVPPVPGPQDEATSVLPPIPADIEQDSRLSALPGLEVREFRFEGNTIFTDSELREQVAEWEGGWVTPNGLRDVQARLTRFYVESGYVISGALLPDQEVEDGVVTILIKEGGITGIELDGNHYLRPRYITGRLKTGQPLMVGELENRIQLLQRDPMVKRINAQVAPAPVQGEAVLRVKVEEENPVAAGMVFDNSRPASIGSNQLSLWAAHKSLLGLGDRFSVAYDFNEGPDGYWLGYALPMNAQDTTLLLAYEDNEAVVSETPFDDIDIESTFDRAEIGIRHPFLKTLNREFALSLGLEWRHAETFLLDEHFSFSPGVIDGETKVTLVHFVQEWLDQNPERLIALRSDIRQGVDMFDATTNSGSLPDGRYLAWLGQFRWVERLPVLDSRLVFRGVAQAADESLLPSEKISIGGMETVRGYRENYITTDEGFALGVEWQIPLGHVRIPKLSTGFNDGLLELAVFFDHGRGSNKSGLDPDTNEISSVGLGLLWQPAEKISAEVYWGYALDDEGDFDDHDLQDDGISFIFNIGFI
jgi:hemolysin activation/secretion protein